MSLIWSLACALPAPSALSSRNTCTSGRVRDALALRPGTWRGLSYSMMITSASGMLLHADVQCSSKYGQVDRLT